MKSKPTIVTILALTLTACSTPQRWIITAPAGDRPATVVPGGTSVLPNGRLIDPLGKQVQVAPHPYGLAVSHDGTMIATANSGVRPFSITLITGVGERELRVRQIPEGHESDEGVLAAVFMGLAFSPDDRILYVGGGQEAKVILFDTETGKRIGDIPLDGPSGERVYEHSYIGDLCTTADGKTLYCVDQTNFRVCIVDLEARCLRSSVPVGRYPFGLTLSPDERRLWVANVGMYEYRMLPGVDIEDPDRSGISFPAFGQGSREAREGTEVEGYRVPGLGDPNAPESFSVWGIDVTDGDRPSVVSRIKTGHPVGAKVEDFPTVGGAAPNSLVATAERVYVSNGNNDTISVIDAELGRVVEEIPLVLDERLNGLRGAIPFGLALDPAGRRLYVAEAGINAVAVISLPEHEVLGHLPVAWFPSKLRVTPDGKRLCVANAKGYGSGPNGGPAFDAKLRGSYVGNLMRGVVSIIDLEVADALEELSARVVRNNFRFTRPDAPEHRGRERNPVPLDRHAARGPIEHVVFIAKENRTYDEVFGQLKAGDGEATLARFGEGVRVRSNDGKRTLAPVDVMPNHLALARRFAISDNFFCDSDVSADGHRWLVGVYPNQWCETGVAASYGGGRSFRWPSKAPGIFGFVGSSGAVYPEDYNEAGSLWDHLHRHEVPFFNFGLGFEFNPGIEKQKYKDSGIRLPINYPLPGPLFARTSRTYPTYNMQIPDQFRASRFLAEMEELWPSGERRLPAMLTLMLPGDHGAAERPEEGFPFFASFMADNDLALGRIVEALSQRPEWKSMAIIVTEDDPQGGQDHVDAHRSILMVISPWAKRGAVSHVHLSFGSIMKTFWNVFGLPCLNHYDAGATDLHDLFTETPDFRPYRARAVDPRLFDPAKALDPMDEDFDWEAAGTSPRMDDVDLMQRWAERRDASGK